MLTAGPKNSPSPSSVPQGRGHSGQRPEFLVVFLLPSPQPSYGVLHPSAGASPHPISRLPSSSTGVPRSPGTRAWPQGRGAGFSAPLGSGKRRLRTWGPSRSRFQPVLADTWETRTPGRQTQGPPGSALRLPGLLTLDHRDSGGQRPPHPLCSRPRGRGEMALAPQAPARTPPRALPWGDCRRPGTQGRLFGDATTRRSPPRSGASRPGAAGGGCERLGRTPVPLGSPGPPCARLWGDTFTSWKMSAAAAWRSPERGPRPPRAVRGAAEAGPGNAGPDPRAGRSVPAPLLVSGAHAGEPRSGGRRKPETRLPAGGSRVFSVRPTELARWVAPPQSQGRLEQIQAGVSIRPLPRRRARGPTGEGSPRGSEKQNAGRDRPTPERLLVPAPSAGRDPPDARSSSARAGKRRKPSAHPRCCRDERPQRAHRPAQAQESHLARPPCPENALLSLRQACLGITV